VVRFRPVGASGERLVLDTETLLIFLDKPDSSRLMSIWEDVNICEARGKMG
jgi:hypothetical protein